MGPKQLIREAEAAERLAAIGAFARERQMLLGLAERLRQRAARLDGPPSERKLPD